MTTQTVTSRDQRARATVDAVIRRALQSPAPREIAVSAHDNHSGEPALYVSVTMPDERDIPDIPTQNRLSSELLSSLREMDDDRFPYVFYGPRSADPKNTRTREAT